MATPTITFLGGVESVTGSRFLLESEGYKLLVEAGMFQGLKELRLKNWEPFCSQFHHLMFITKNLVHRLFQYTYYQYDPFEHS